jgi:serine/threonine-protein kinase
VKGETVSHYRILDELGRGGMGVVYLAEDTRLGRRVALKFLPSDASRDEEVTQRFIQEARTASALDHPNVCTIYEIGESHDGRLFIAMACYDGETLEQRLRRGRLEVAEALDVALQIARGLRKAHEAGIVHRDIKPANVFLTRDGIVKILDFGIAKLGGARALTRTGMMIGTGAYMSPEQVTGQEADARTDLWSLGVVLYEMLVGTRPFGGEREVVTMYAVVNEPAPPLHASAPHVPVAVEALVARLLKKDPRDRPASAAELARELAELGKQSPGSLTDTRRPAATVAARGGRPPRRRLAFAVATASIALLAATAFWSIEHARSGVPTLGILPFDTANAGAGTQYLGDGIRDGLVARLSRIKPLKVKSRRTPLGADEDIRAVGEALGVDTIGTGRLVQRGAELEIVAELIDSRDGTIIWSGQYSGDDLGLLAIESDLAGDIAAELRLNLSTETEQRVVRATTSNPAANRLYLQGRYFWNRRSADGFEQAVALYQRAIALDPNFALAWAGLSGAHLMRMAWGLTTPAEAAPLVNAAAERALELDPTLAEPHAVLGYLKTLYDWDWDGAQREFLLAIELDGNHSTAHHWYAFLLSTQGDSKGAIEEILLARDLEPDSPIINSEVGHFYIVDRQYERALEELRKANVLDPSYPSTVWGMVRAYGFLGRVEEGQAAARTLLSTATDPVPLLYGGANLPLVGLGAEARDIYARALETSKSTYVMPGLLGLLAGALGERDDAFAHFSRGLDERSLVISWLRDPVLDGIRADPRYAALLTRVGLTP